MTGLSYCGEFVKQNDPDRFLLSLFCKAQCRKSLWAIFAFNYEISKTREVVSESTLGHIRLQWWRDEIAKIYEGTPTQGNEILSALSKAIQKHGLPRKCFDDLIYAREFDLENVLPGDLQGFLTYCDFTSTPLMYLSMTVVGGNPENEPIKDVAINYAMACLLRNIPYHAKQGRAYLPESLLKEEGISKEELFSCQKKGEITLIIKKILENHCKAPKTSQVFLKSSNILADLYFKQIKGQGYDVFAPKVQIPPAFKVLRLYCKTKFF